MMFSPDTAIALVGFGLIAVFAMVWRAIMSGYAMIALSIFVETVLVVLAMRQGFQAWILPIGWGFVALLGALATIGADLRRTLDTRIATAPTPTAPPSMADRKEFG